LKPKIFLVGAGVIKCEHLENMVVVMGVWCGEKGLVTITDMDNLKLSNHSRQFLFRQGDIQKPKSETAAREIK
jgi:ubiquitin-activating enzyme E1